MKKESKLNKCVPNSHFIRSHTPTILVPVVELPYKRECRVKELSSITGRITNVVDYKTVDRYEEMKNYRVSDFSIENLTAINASMPFVQMTMSPLNQADQVADVLSSIQNNSNNN